MSDYFLIFVNRPVSKMLLNRYFDNETLFSVLTVFGRNTVDNTWKDVYRASYGNRGL